MWSTAPPRQRPELFVAAAEVVEDLPAVDPREAVRQVVEVGARDAAAKPREELPVAAHPAVEPARKRQIARRIVLVEDDVGRQRGPAVDSLEEIINSTYKAGGNLVVPSFSVERAQELLYFINELINEKKIPHMLSFLDSPMAIRVTEVFKKHAELFDEETTALIRQGDSPRPRQRGSAHRTGRAGAPENRSPKAPQDRRVP